jgi:hypothetical protein
MNPGHGSHTVGVLDREQAGDLPFLDRSAPAGLGAMTLERSDHPDAGGIA